MKIYEKILNNNLKQYFNIQLTENLEKEIKNKERIGTVRNMEIIIYSNDHNPPHFHVKSKNKEINAKFKIENGEYISGKISSKDLKRVKGFYNDIKTRIVMEDIWNKRI